MKPDTEKSNVNTTATELVVVDQKLEAAIQQANLSQDTAQGLLSEFAPLFAKARTLCADAEKLAVTDATQVTEIKQARALRLAIRAVRIESEKKRKALKEDSLRKGKAIDGVHNVLEYAVAPVETKLLEMEEFAERAEAARKAALKAEREAALKPYGVSVEFYQLGEMGADAFAQLLAGTKAAHEAKIEAAKKAEEERIAKEHAEAEAKAAREKAEAEERERIRAENERLRKEREQIEAAAREAAAKAKAEREAAEAKAKKEREEAARALAEQKRIADEAAAKERKRAEIARAEVEAKAKAEREAMEKKMQAERDARIAAERAAAEQERARLAKIEAERQAAERAAKAPDKDKLLSYAAQIRGLALPTFATDSAKSLAKTIESQREKFALWIEEKAAGL